MIDFIKLDIRGICIDELLQNNKYLDFEGRFDEKTGVVNLDIKEAFYKELKFQIKKLKYLNMSGSIHKYWKGNNHSDFSYSELCMCIDDLSNKFDFNPCQAELRNIEFGVNIRLLTDPSKYLKCLINHKGTPFEMMRSKNRSIGYDCVKQQYTIKVYNKGLQCGLNFPLLRYEIKVVKMEWLKRTEIRTLSDLLDKNKLKQLKQILIQTWEEILVTDLSLGNLLLTAKEKELFKDGSNPKYWKEIKRISPKRHDDHRRKFIKLIEKYGQGEKEELKKKIKEKSTLLLSNSIKKLSKLTGIKKSCISLNNHSSGMVKQVNLEESNIKICLRCKKDFNDRRSDAIFCSEKCRTTEKDARKTIRRSLRRNAEKYNRKEVLFNPDIYLKLTPKQKVIATTCNIF